MWLDRATMFEISNRYRKNRSTICWNRATIWLFYKNETRPQPSHNHFEAKLCPNFALKPQIFIFPTKKPSNLHLSNTISSPKSQNHHKRPPSYSLHQTPSSHKSFHPNLHKWPEHLITAMYNHVNEPGINPKRPHQILIHQIKHQSNHHKLNHPLPEIHF